VGSGHLHRKNTHKEGRPGSRKFPAGFLPAFALLGLLIYAANGIYTVAPNERAFVRRFGKALPRLRLPGLHVGLPAGLDKVVKLKVNERKRLGVGLTLAERALGLKADPRKAEGLTGDRNLLVVPAVVTYRIADPKAYLRSVADSAGVVRAVSASVLTSLISRMPVDDVLNVRRNEIAWKAVQEAQRKLDALGIGVAITWISLEGLAPPREIADAFREVAQAKEDKERMINEAHGYAERLKPLTRGEVQKILTDAEAFAEELVKKAQGEADRFLKIAAEFASGRELTARRLILETLEKVLPRVRKILVGKDARKELDLQLLEEK